METLAGLSLPHKYHVVRYVQVKEKRRVNR
jgi:hypothetical protein